MKLIISLTFAALMMDLPGAAPIPVAAVAPETVPDFARDIHPLLKRSCLACHNTTRAKAGLNLETPEAILSGGDSGPAATPGKGVESLLLRSASHAEESAMPPPGNKVNATDFSPQELGLLRLWIDQGMKGGPVLDKVVEWRPFPLVNAPVSAAALSESGRIAAAARGNQVALTEVATGISLGSLTDPELGSGDPPRNFQGADHDAVMAVAFGGDDLIATGGYRTVRLWRRAPLTENHPALVLPSPITALASQAGWAAAGGADGTIRIWRAGDADPRTEEWRNGSAAIKTLCFSPDGKFLFSSDAGRSVRICEVPSGTTVFHAASGVGILAACFLNTGREIAIAGADGMLRLYPFPLPPTDSGFPSAVREWKTGSDSLHSMAAPDPAGSRLIWMNGDAVLRGIDTADGKIPASVPMEHWGSAALKRGGHRQQAAQRLASASAALLTAAVEAVKKESENLRSSHQAQEKARAAWQRKVMEAQAAGRSKTAFPDDQNLAGAADKSAMEAGAAGRAFADARTNAELAVRLTGEAMQKQAAAEGAAAAAEATLTECSAALEACRQAAALPMVVRSLTLADEGKTTIISTAGGTVHWHSTLTGELLDTAQTSAKAPPPEGLLLASGGAFLLSAGAEGRVAAWPLRRPFVIDRKIGHRDDAATFSGRVLALDFSSDNRLLAAGGGVPSRSGEVSVWNTEDGSPALEIKSPHTDTVNAVAFSPDDSFLATAGSDRQARVFSVADGLVKKEFEGHSGPVLGIGWRSDGLALVTGGSDKTLRYWDVGSGAQTRSIVSFGKEVSALAWLGTGDRVASASGDETVRLDEEKLPGSKGFCFTLAADHSGALVAAGGEDGVLRIWNTGTKQLLREIR